ncbi:MAG: extracellular solute-binding protein family 1 [Paenibacillaceae bacterium]|nr:extracellular solute-binding protein family 1 [Paenibacillaceae bacterium]
MKRKLYLALLSFITALSLTACSGSGAAGGDKAAGTSGESKEVKKQQTLIDKKEPFSLFMSSNSGLTPEDFDAQFGQRIAKKFPFITLKYAMKKEGSTIQDLVAAGTIPDIIRTDIPSLKADYLDMKLGYDLRDMVKKNNYDLKRFVPSFIKEMVDTGHSKDGALYGLPVPPYYPQVLFYNKDLFDKFGVPYPKDGMTWDQIYDIAKKMTRSEGGKEYRGFSANLQAGIRDNPFSLGILDPTKDQLTDLDKWKIVFNNFMRFYQLPGNKIASSRSKESSAFTSGDIAMQLAQYHPRTYPPDTFKWDFVSYPTMTGAPKVVAQRGPAYWSITSTSKYKDEDFQIIMELLSDEAQAEYSRNAMTTTLVSKSIRDELGKNNPIYKDKNNKAVYYYEPADPTAKRSLDAVDVPGRDQEKILIDDAFFEVATGQSDVNTALSKANEKMKLAVEAEKSK